MSQMAKSAGLSYKAPAGTEVNTHVGNPSREVVVDFADGSFSTDDLELMEVLDHLVEDPDNPITSAANSAKGD